MNLFIKLIVFSFPLVIATGFFWPVVENILLSPAASVEGELSPDPLIEKIRALTAKNLEIQIPSQVVAVQPQSNIFRWVDENGSVVFSDNPSHEGAVAYTPKEIGYLQASDSIIQQDSRAQAQLAPEKVSSAIYVVPTQTYQATSQAEITEYQFSNTSAGQKHGYVLLSGRISNGGACKQLRVVASAKSDRGGYVRGVDVTRHNGFGSALFEMKLRSSWNGSGRRPQWEISDISASCDTPQDPRSLS